MFTETELFDIDIALGKDLKDCNKILGYADTKFVAYIMNSKIERLCALRDKTKKLIPKTICEADHEL